ncbi:hypothetical protein A2V56_02780 [Candidatus Woesebacteria bacterium RBG_19FT_COMBO_42_9]|uniref:Uncharacterized protein n=1 Tax=Candidatus Woesebacteria bacterium RBG_16_42_24 TaxID=1802485 RepID=A0A1F7XKW0_9BACT|nr:MAG: hypothetical protein A2V97_02200 [Candidatus Woesebacteria bacterium RBG_16_42_24]OGM16252.1 MAG: hypothetical protein A2V56_02780 [Candidatus Woesebacteria bacterium RBG_19FT_COMBO_42_9]OGM67805.1 MAG: hypothetical protein A2985_04850 [Candidatus Woesebacteria bacterium RIFCSPLOWO2_01_FULL_43_11]
MSKAELKAESLDTFRNWWFVNQGDPDIPYNPQDEWTIALRRRHRLPIDATLIDVLRVAMELVEKPGWEHEASELVLNRRLETSEFRALLPFPEGSTPEQKIIILLQKTLRK